MPTSAPEKAELIEEPEDQEIDPTDLTSLYFRDVRLSPEQRTAIETDLFDLYTDAVQSRADLDTQLAHWNDMAEGVAQPKNFPWQDSSNLFIPVTETKLNDVHAAARATLLKGDAMFYVKNVGIKADYDKAAKIERFLNFKCQVELPMKDRLGQGIYAGERDGTVVFQVQWMEKKDLVRKIKKYQSPDEFIGKYSTPDESGLSEQQYGKILTKLAQGGQVSLLETSEETIFRGPVVTTIELVDFLMSPMTAPKTEYARFVGKRFTLREAHLKKYEKFDGWNKKAVNKVIDSNETGPKDDNTQLKDDIEGITRRQLIKEYNCIDGIHRYDLDGDGIEERYLCVFHPKTKSLLMYMHYPYLHNRDCFIPARLKKRVNRFLGRGLCQMMDDINSEINTQHNQRIDSRTITTVPSFKKRKGTTTQFDPSRKDQRFYPGVVYTLDQMDDIQQFDIRPTDLSESIQEESNLMELSDKQTGSSQLRSGRETKSDPRAPAAKVNALLSRSDIRMDDYFEELGGDAAENEGLAAVGLQILDLYYQFFDKDMSEIPDLTPNMNPNKDKEGNPKNIQIQQDDLNVRDASGKLQIKVVMAKTSASQNPDSMLMRFMQLYSLLSQDPLVGGRPAGRLALDRKLLALAREENPEQFLPKDEQEAGQAMGIAAIMEKMKPGSGGAKNKGGGHAHQRGGTTAPGTPAAGGSTRPTQ